MGLELERDCGEPVGKLEHPERPLLVGDHPPDGAGAPTVPGHEIDRGAHDRTAGRSLHRALQLEAAGLEVGEADGHLSGLAAHHRDALQDGAVAGAKGADGALARAEPGEAEATLGVGDRA